MWQIGVLTWKPHIVAVLRPFMGFYYRAQNDYTHIFIIWELIS